MNNKIIIIGTGGHAKSVIDVIESTNDWEIIGLIGLKNDLNKSLLGYKVLGTDHDLESIRKNLINLKPELKYEIIHGKLSNKQIEHSYERFFNKKSSLLKYYLYILLLQNFSIP